MNYIIHNGELYHYGVKGMRWGVIKKQQPETKMKRVSRAFGKVSIGTGVAGTAAMVGSKIARKKGHHDAANALYIAGRQSLTTSLETGAVSAGLAIGDRTVRTKHAKEAAPKSEHISKDTTVSQAAQSNKSKKGKIVAASIVGGAAVSAAAVGTAMALYWKKMKPFTDYMLGKQ